MRLLHTFHDDRYAKTFSAYLLQQGIANKLELEKNTDWSSAEYGNINSRVWIIDEDDLEKAKECLNQFLDHPGDARFTPLSPQPHSWVSAVDAPPFDQKPPKAPRPIPPPPVRPLPPAGYATFYTILLCTLIFFASMLTSRPVESYPASIPPAPLFFSTIIKELYFDYPQAFSVVDKVIAAYGFEKVIHPQTLPPEGQHLLRQALETPYWKGLYEKAVDYLKNPNQPLEWNAPLFEKLQEGEGWRLFTPALLHGNIFHLFFNMMWLFVIGRQMEEKLKAFRYLLFILLTALITNTSQYLMSGSNFLGISGVLCAMIAFVWERQRIAPWEGYQLLPSTLKFIAGFIGLLALLGLASFFFEISGKEEFSIPIANTAHLVGALTGFLLGRLAFFSWKLPGGS